MNIEVQQVRPEDGPHCLWLLYDPARQEPVALLNRGAVRCLILAYAAVDPNSVGVWLSEVTGPDFEEADP